MPVRDMMSMADTFVQSGMFPDMKQAAAAFVKIQAGQEMGIAPFASMSGIHIIQGKPTVGSSLIASAIKGSMKYDYKVIKLDELECTIDFFEGSKKIGTSTFTMNDAKKAQTKNIDKFPKNMLFARAISNGVKWFCPDVFNGPVYVEGEVLTEDIDHEEMLPAQSKKGPIPEEKSKPIFTKDNFDKAKAANATVERIREVYLISPETESEYLKFISSDLI